MKKIFLSLVVSTLGYISCSDDVTKENQNIETEIILGTWKKIASSEGEWNECREKSTITFTEEGKVSKIDYEGSNEKCEQEASTPESAGLTWIKIEENTYQLSSKEGNIIKMTIEKGELIIGNLPNNYHKYKKN